MGEGGNFNETERQEDFFEDSRRVNETRGFLPEGRFVSRLMAIRREYRSFPRMQTFVKRADPMEENHAGCSWIEERVRSRWMRSLSLEREAATKTARIVAHEGQDHPVI